MTEARTQTESSSLVPAHRSLLSLRAVAAGTLVTTAGTGLLTTLSGGFGLMGFDQLNATALADAGPAFGVWLAASFVIAATAGGYVASHSLSSDETRAGVLNGVVSWAASCLLVVGIVWVGYLIAIPVGVADADALSAVNGVAAHWGYFLADALALFGAGLGGALGVRQEARYFQREATTRAASFSTTASRSA